MTSEVHSCRQPICPVLSRFSTPSGARARAAPPPSPAAAPARPPQRDRRARRVAAARRRRRRPVGEHGAAAKSSVRASTSPRSSARSASPPTASTARRRAAPSSASSARNGLAVDGIVGPQTLAALGLSAAREAQRAAPAARCSQRIAAVRVRRRPDRRLAPTAATAASTSSRARRGARWAATGDPAARAPEAGRTRMAAKLLARAAPRPGPNCALASSGAAAGASRMRSTRAGAPATTALSATSFVTTVFVPDQQLSPTVTPRRMHAP